MKEGNTVKEFKVFGSTCFGTANTYPNGNLRIQIYESETYEPICTATTTLKAKLEPGLAHIKNYFENTGILEALIEAGIVTEVVGYTPSGMVSIPLCKINVEMLQH